MMKAIIAGVLALVLAGCATTEEKLAKDEAVCAGYGAGPGSAAHAQCMIEVAKLRQEERRLKLQQWGAMMSATGSSLAGGARPASVASTTCFIKSEVTSGFNKICYYDCLGSLTAQNIGAADLCPLTITR